MVIYIIFLGYGDTETEIDYPSTRFMFKRPQRLSSKAVMHLASSVNMLDEQNEEKRG